MVRISKALKLAPPSPSVIADTHAKVREIYARAYGWTPPPARADAERLASTRMREYVRRWINEWDLKRLFPAYEPETEVREVELTYAEDAELAAPSEGDVGEEGGEPEARG